VKFWQTYLALKNKQYVIEPLKTEFTGLYLQYAGMVFRHLTGRTALSKFGKGFLKNWLKLETASSFASRNF